MQNRKSGKRQKSCISHYDYGARFYDPVIGRWTTVDPLVEFGQESTSPYGYVFDEPVKNTDPDGRMPDEDPPGKLSMAGNFVKGVGQSLWGTVTGTVNTILHPINTVAAIHSLNTPQGAVDLSMSAFGAIDKFNNGNSDIKANMLGHATGDVAQLFVGVEEIKIASEALKSVKSASEGGNIISKASEGVQVTKAASSSPSFIVNSAGEAVAIPKGAKGPFSPLKGSGMTYEGGSGGFGMNKRVTGVRIMDANANQGRRVNYMNATGQTVDSATGKTIINTDPRGHIPFKL